MGQFTCGFLSYTLKRDVDVNVVIPTASFAEVMDKDVKASHRPKAKYPVLYLLHGYANNYMTWLKNVPVARFAEERGIAVVTFSGENSFYMNHDGNGRMYDFLRDELPDFVCGMFPISARREDTYIAGLSMGGYGAILHAVSNPEKYSAFGAFSAAIFETGVKSEPDAVVGDKLFDLFEAVNGFGNIADMPKGYISCGTDDTLLEGNIKFKDLCQSLGGDITWKEVSGYGHEWPLWGLELEAFLDWIPRTDPYAGTKKQV